MKSTSLFRPGAGFLLGLALAGGAAAPLRAGTLPAAFMVKGVDGNDLLNIRAEPSAGATVLGTIGPQALNVEVLEISPDGKWGKVAAGGEGNGWVSLAYLERQPVLDPALVPRPMTCLGTEPFWSLGLFEQGAEWTTPDTPRTDLGEVTEAVAMQGFHVRAEAGPERVFNLTISREWCTDGMSDRQFGFAAKLFIESPDGNALLSGCCTLDHR
ncbi:COG3650 family protein [Neotabrizicola sp. sgz301269]|uniref:COG3650 family protein n=1 Tax=Neotabrizicola sp. sgz301269 TaxID=3276282 RepID=UPI00376FF47E